MPRLEIDQLRRLLPPTPYKPRIVEGNFIADYRIEEPGHKVVVIYPPSRFSHRIPKPLTLDVSSDSGSISIGGFEAQDKKDKKTARVIGGILIGIRSVPRILVLYAESFSYARKAGLGGALNSTHLLKVDPSDQKIKVEPMLEDYSQGPFILDNGKRNEGLLITEVSGLRITSTNNNILIARTIERLI